jgi:fructosamine-3-kinase
MILITSAAYVGSGLHAEFGKLPPCMLPVQNRRLYCHQIKLFSDDEDIVISLPKNYLLTEFDAANLGSKNVKIVCVPERLSLGESIVYTLNVLARFNEPVKILHGDTLIEKIPIEMDLCAIAQSEDDYSWSYYQGLDDRFVYAGYFAFNSQPLLISSIIEKDFNFIKGVRAYNKVNKLEYRKIDGWLDFGMINSYYRSKSQMTTQRAFNDLKIDKYSVKKYSEDSKKILAEANWFKSLPKELKHFIPGIWDEGIADNKKGFYQIEYFYLNSLADLFVFGKNPVFVWKIILNACKDFIDHTAKLKPSDQNKVSEDSLNLYGAKTKVRLKQFCLEQDINMARFYTINGKIVPSLNEIVEEVSELMAEAAPQFMRVIHGDFCFSNILYDFKSQSIKVIDPRGVDMAGNYSVYGDIRYDIAKLSHSVLGMYDFIIGGNYNLISKDKYDLEITFPNEIEISDIQTYFKSMLFAGYNLTDLKVYPILIHLFLSMLPLHNDHPMRQNAMLANALRLYVEYKNQE